MFEFSNTHVSQQGGKKTVRHVKIKNGKGYKKVTSYKNGKKMGTVKKSLKSDEISMIRVGKFIPGLFSDCKHNNNSKTCKNR